jgi:hypothetical protein
MGFYQVLSTLCRKRRPFYVPALSVASISRHPADVYRWSNELHDLSYNSSRTADRFFMKFGTEVMPLEACPDSYF